MACSCIRPWPGSRWWLSRLERPGWCWPRTWTSWRSPGWSAVRAAAYAAAVGDLACWPSHRQVYRAAGLPPVVYASAGRRRDGPISREGSVQLRRALLGLGVGLWRHDGPARAWATQLRARGKAKGVVATALANRACRIAFAMVRDQQPYQPDRWR
jgi:transposase